MKHLFATDYDGTLYQNDTVTQTDLDAIKAFRDAGNLFGICSGRNIDSLKREAEKFSIPLDFLIGINGGIVLDAEGNEIYSSGLTETLAKEMVTVFESFKTAFYSVSDGYRICFEVRDQSLASDYFGKYSVPLADILASGPRGFYVHAGSEEKSVALAEVMNRDYGEKGITAFPNLHMVDIGMQGVDKATGINHLVNHFGVEGGVYVAGDSYNDFPMIKEFHSFAMKSGVESLHKYSNEVVDTVSEAIQSILKATS